MKRILVVAISLCLSSVAFASNLTQLVDQFYAQKEMMTTSSWHKNSAFAQRRDGRRPMHDCQPSGRSCADVACDKLGSFGCNEMGEVTAVNRACRGNYDGDCLEAACAKLGAFGCNEMQEVETVARACVGNYDTDCLNSTCQRLGSFGCNEMSEVEQVLRECSGN